MTVSANRFGWGFFIWAACFVAPPQNNFLKLLEETDVSLERESGMRIMGMGRGGGSSTINTRNSAHRP